MATPKKKVYTLDNLAELKSAVKFTTEEEVGVNNIYMKKDDWKALGSPKAVKLTVEAA